jgi:hypothetical protein
VNVGIIGTAGRREDAARINREFYLLMKQAVRNILRELPREITLVSGGAAVADHIAVQLFIECADYRLDLHLPAPFVDGKYQECRQQADPGRTANYWHRIFASSCHVQSLSEIAIVLSSGANATVSSGFSARNAKVAAQADLLIALTFGQQNVVKKGGTAKTVQSFLNLGKTSARHVDLNTMTTYADARVHGELNERIS